MFINVVNGKKYINGFREAIKKISLTIYQIINGVNGAC